MKIDRFGLFADDSDNRKVAFNLFRRGYTEEEVRAATYLSRKKVRDLRLAYFNSAERDK